MNQKEHVLNAALLGIGLAYVLEPAGDAATFRTVVGVSVPVVLGALFPDVDAHFGRHRKTFHNLPVLALFLAFPVAFGNLQWVWLGVLSHFVLDVLGTTRGVALWYPLWAREFNLPFGVPVSSNWAGLVTLCITALELAVAAAVVWYAPPELATLGAHYLGQ
jgi:membrane-bound metal-dependent hydrolase YbcI (DUF457 family)